MQCSRCQADNRDGLKFCEDCGARLAVACPTCSAEITPGKRFCGFCGASLSAGQSAGRFSAPDSYTPKHLAERILTSKAALEGERKQVTVLFADLKGSMELLADRDPEEARTILDPVLEHMMEAVHRYEGTVNQVMGDGIMALFGAPLTHEDHAVRACYAALRMQESVRHYAESVRREEGVTIRIRVGLNSGEVVVRAIGSDLHMDYTAVGQTTHLAARMEQLAEPGTALLTSATVALSEAFVQVKSLGPVRVKGLSEAVEVYELFGANPVRSRFQAHATRGLTKFVGRTSEISQLGEALDLGRGGRGQVVAVVGEPGVGKSRLFWEFTHSHRVGGCMIVEAGSVSYGKATSYLPVIELLRTYCQIESRDDQRKIREKVTGKLLSLDRALEPSLPALLALLDIPVDNDEWTQLDPSQRRRRRLDGIKRLLLREAQIQPLIVVFEDLHWIDGETQALLDSLVESLPTARVLLLVNYRPDYRHTWGGKTYYRQLRIDPLTPKSADELLDGLLGAGPTLGTLKRLLIERTDGNPFFLEESVRSLVETEMLVGERGAYRVVKALSAIQVPATVQVILAARIDRLSPEEKNLLQIAAVIGKDVPLALLQAVADQPGEAIRTGITRLQAAEFIYERSLFPDPEFIFKHALTQEVAYTSLLLERRRELHARIVHTLEALQADRPPNDVDRLAHHAFRGALWEKAVAYFRLAGTKAMSSTYREAVVYFEQALEALHHLPESRDTMEQAIDIRLDLRRVLAPLADRARILDHIQKAETLASALGDRRRLSWIAYAMAYYHYLAHEQEQSAEAGQRALVLSGGADVAHEIAVNMLLGYSLYVMGDYRQASRVLRRNIDALIGNRVRERFGLPVFPAVTCRERLVRCLAEMGEFDEGTRLGEEGLRMAEELKDPLSLVQMCVGLSDLYMLRSDLNRAIPVLERGLTVGRQWNISLYIARLASAVGRAYVRTGRVTEGLALLKEGAEEKAVLGRAGQLARLADGYLVAGDLAMAWEQAEEALDLSRRYKEKGLEAWILHLHGEVAARRVGYVDNAERLYHDAMARADELGMRPLVAHCHLGLSKLYRQTGKRQQASEHLATAGAMYREMGMTYWLEQAEREMRELT